MSSKKKGKAIMAAQKTKKVTETATVTPAAEVKPKKEAKPRPEGALPALPKMPSSKRPRKARPQKPCQCGCGQLTSSQWVPGHDARARGWALRIERDILTMKDVPANEQAGAKFMLEERKKAGLTGKGATLVKGKSIKKVEPEGEGAGIGEFAGGDEGGEAINQ